MYTSGINLYYKIAAIARHFKNAIVLKQQKSNFVFQRLHFILLLLFCSSYHFTSAQSGAALDFDGIDDIVDIADAPWNDFGSSDFTVEFWVKKQATTVGWSNLSAIGKWNIGSSPGTNEWHVGLTSDGTNQLPAFTVEVGNNRYQVAGTTPLTLNIWYHIAAVRQGTTIRIYVNGTLENTLTDLGITSINNITGRSIKLGRIDGFSAHTNMEMDELRIWNEARSASQISQYQNCELPAGAINLLAYYKFNQGIASANNSGINQLSDGSGNIRNGSLLNFALNGGVSNWVAPGSVTKPVFSFSASVGGRPAQSINTAAGNAAMTLNFCTGEYYAISGYSSTPASQVRYLETVVGGTTNVTYNNIPIPVPRTQGELAASFFTGSYGPYGLSSGTSGQLIWKIVPYYDNNNNLTYNSGIDCPGDTLTLTFNINAQQDPVIVAQPQNTPICQSGSGATLSVAATGPGLAYQWQVFNTGTSIFENIGGATNASYTTPSPVTTTNTYRVIVFSNFGLPCQDSILSNSVQVRLLDDELACSELVNISLGSDCELEVTPDLILVGNLYYEFYTVQILNENGNPIGNIVNSSFLNKKWVVKVINNCSGNSCWGEIFVEDKLPPSITCRPDTLINCYDTTDFTKPPFLPLAYDNCNPNIPVKVIFNEVLPYKNCTTDTVAVRTIIYQPVNATITCQRKIYYLKANIMDILIPKNYDGAPGNHAPLSCTYDWETGIKNKYPDPHETGSPYFPGYNPLTNGIYIDNICRIQLTFIDQVLIGACPIVKIIIRKWTIMDWCTRNTREETQIIKIIDDSGPEFDIPNILVHPIAHACSSNVIAPPPLNVSDCSGNKDYTYKVEFKLDPDCNLSDTSGTYSLVLGAIKSELLTSGPYEGSWQISGLPAGCTWLRYTVTDPCGNSSKKYIKINVNDGVAPVAVCDEHTVVTLSPEGKATVYALSVDDGSHDDCSDISLKIRRMTPGCNASTIDWTDYVDICCTDKLVVVEMKVTDKSGNSSVCMANIHIQDKILPTIVCPSNITLGCGGDTSAIATGKPIAGISNPAGGYFYDNCGATLSWTNTGKLNECNEGAIRRTYRVTDNAGNTNTCAQIITVKNAVPFSGPSWHNVGEVTLTGCSNTDTNPTNTGKPEYTNTSCSKVISNYKDKIFDNVAGVCYRIERKWTVVDWCKFRTQGDTITYRWPSVLTEGINQWTHKQIINVIDNTKPVVSANNAGKEFSINENSCNQYFTLQETATDCNPTATAALKWTYEVRLNRSTSIYKSGNGTGGTLNASGYYESGTYEIIWQVQDQCGNVEIKPPYYFYVNDRKKPTAYCLSTITTVVMPSTGMVGINARSFNLGSKDNCIGPLLYSFSGTLSDSTRIFRCSDFPEGQDTIHRSLKMYVWDQANNFEFCSVSIIIQKNTTPCNKPGILPDVTIEGRITNEKNQTLDVVSVYLSNDDSDINKMQTTDENGKYAFKQIPPSDSYTLKAVKNDDHLNGISTLDLVMIQQHILGMKPFHSPYQYLAADVTNDHKVTAADLTEIRKLILGITPALSKTNSWRFFNRATSIPEIADPWSNSESIFVGPNTGDVMTNNFTAVKSGDVNTSAKTNATTTSTESRTLSGTITIDDRSYSKNKKIVIPVNSHNISKLTGIQTTFEYAGDKLQFKGIISGALTIDDYAYVSHDGKIVISWFSTSGEILVSDRTLFALEFESIENGTLGSSIYMNSNIFKNEYYNEDNEEHALKLVMNNIFDLPLLEVSQNTPNPFSSSTVIDVFMPQNGTAQLKVYDNSGKLILNKSDEFKKGKNAFTIQHEDLGTPGIYYYEIKSLGQSFMKKLIKINE